jgi:hypothetical protein
MSLHQLATTPAAEARRWNRMAAARDTEIQCTGNCNQGRACDCVADVPEPDRVAAARFWGAYALVLITAALAFAAGAYLTHP